MGSRVCPGAPSVFDRAGREQDQDKQRQQWGCSSPSLPHGQAPAGCSGSWIHPLVERGTIQPLRLAFVRAEQQQCWRHYSHPQICGAKAKIPRGSTAPRGSWGPFQVSVALAVTPQLLGSHLRSASASFHGGPKAVIWKQLVFTNPSIRNMLITCQKNQELFPPSVLH